MQSRHRTGNRARVWGWLLGHGVASRAEVAGAVGLSKVAVANIVAELIEGGWLSESGQLGGYAGRPAGLIDLHPQAGGVLGLDLQRRAVSALETDLRGERGRRRAQDLHAPQEATAAVLALLSAAHAAPAHGPLRQVVLSVPAPVGARGRPEAPSGLPEFDAGKVERWCRDHDLALAFENDVKLAAVAEHRAGAAAGTDHFALLAERDTGVALGLFLAGRLYRGDRGRAGELSLLRWPDPAGPRPLETLAPDQRRAALAQIVAGLAVALDLRLLVVQPAAGVPDASASSLINLLQALAPSAVTAVPSHHAGAGPLLGAALEAARLAQERLSRAGLPSQPSPTPAQPQELTPG